LSYALLNLTGFVDCRRDRRLADEADLHLCLPAAAAVILLLGALGKLPRVESSTRKEGTHRRYFYGTVWAVTAAQTMLLVLWKVLPQTGATSWVKLGAFVGMLALMGSFAYRGMLPRTRRFCRESAWWRTEAGFQAAVFCRRNKRL